MYRCVVLLVCILCLGLASSAPAAQKRAKEPAKAPAASAERIYQVWEVEIDEFSQFAIDQDGIPVSGTIQNFSPDGRLAWETQWVEGRLHGVTRGYHPNRKIKEETTWVNGTLHGLARWYDDKGALLREIVYENGKDPAAPAEASVETPGRDAGETQPGATETAPKAK